MGMFGALRQFILTMAIALVVATVAPVMADGPAAILDGVDRLVVHTKARLTVLAGRGCGNISTASKTSIFRNLDWWKSRSVTEATLVQTWTICLRCME